MRPIIRRLVLAATVLATLVGLTGPASASASPNLFDLDREPVATFNPLQADFAGTVTGYLATSDNGSDRVKIRVEGRLTARTDDCYRIRVEYLDAGGSVVAAEHSGIVSHPAPYGSTSISVDESSKHPNYRNARVKVQRSATCTSFATIDTVTTGLDLPVDGLGARGLEVPVDEHRISIDENGGFLDGQAAMAVVTNPAGILDRGLVRVTGQMGYDGYGCVRALVQGRDEAGGFLGTRYTAWDCTGNTVSIGQDLWFNDPDLHRVDVLLETYGPNGSGPTVPQVFVLD